MLRPGFARLATKPPLTGSAAHANTIGTLRVACCNAATAAVPLAKMTSGDNATNSAAAFCRSPLPHRYSICRLRPSVQPNFCNPWRNAVMRACPYGLSLAYGISTPIRRICPDCCACKASGQATAEPPTSVMNSRRLIAFPEAKDKQSYRFTSAAMHKIAVKYQAHTSALGQQTTLQADRHMSALPSVADIAEAREHVRFSNRPFWVKRFQTVHHFSGRCRSRARASLRNRHWGPSIMGSENEADQSKGRSYRGRT